MEELTRTSTKGADAPTNTATDINPSNIILSELLKGVNEKESNVRF